MEMLRNVEGMLHCRKDPIHFPTDLREFRDHWLFNEKTVKAFEKLEVESNMWKNQQSLTEIARNEFSSVAEGNAEIDVINSDHDEVEIKVDEVATKNGDFKINNESEDKNGEEIMIEEVVTKDDHIITRSKRTAAKDEQPKNPKVAKKAEIIEEKNGNDDDENDALVNLYFNDFDCE